jgi:eukaryotic-like serine/threonine-protein kinase
MGVVWLGYDEVLHRQVAVKEVQLPPGLPAEEATAVRERMLREARAIAALTHPNVIAVYDVAKRGADPLVIMELVKSRSLADLIDQLGQCDEQQAASVADAVAAALEAAHRRGVVHRDVKPGNVLIGDEGQIKLTDFGIARNLAEITMTHSGMIMGTPAYIAPEVIEGEDVEPSSDLWSLGAMLFAAITGELPYDKGTPLQTVTEIAQGEVPSPPDGAPLADIIGALMVKDPRERISLTEVRRRIRPLLPEPGTPVFPPPEDEPVGPADNRPTARFKPQPEIESAPAGASPTLAADPGPLPFAAPALAADPGPLPFPAPGLAPAPGAPPFGGADAGATDREQPLGPPGYPPAQSAPPSPSRPPARRRRGKVASTVLALFAIVLFLLASGAGFAAARYLAGRSILPPKAGTPLGASAPGPPASESALEVRPVQTQMISLRAGLNSGNVVDFTVRVPVGWTDYTEQKAPADLPASEAIHYVNSAGDQELTIERFPDFYPERHIDDYLTWLKGDWGSNLTLSGSPQPIQNKDGNDYDSAEYVSYNTTEGSIGRTVDANLLPRGDDLWIIQVTMPTDQERAGYEDLYRALAPTLVWLN